MKIPPAEMKKIEGAFETQQKPVENRADGSNDKTGMARDRVCLSEESMKYNELEGIRNAAAQKAEQNVSPEKLRRLKAAVESGTYRVSGEDIAAAMIDEP